MNGEGPIEAGRTSLCTYLWDLAVRKLKGCKAPGHDGIFGFWWKKFCLASDFLREILLGWMRTP